MGKTQYFSVLASSRRMMPRVGEWAGFVTDRLLRRSGLIQRVRGTMQRPFHLRGLEHPVILRTDTQDFIVARELLDRREYDRALKLVGEVERPIILDLGANIGLSIRLWQSRFPQAQVVAVEPDGDNFRVCQANVAAGEAPQYVTLLQAAVSDVAGELYIEPSVSSLGHRTTRQPAPGRQKVPAVTMQQLLEEAGQPAQVDLLKCDIEGAEEPLFADCRAWIQRIRVLVVETHAPYNVESLSRHIAQNGGTHQLLEIEARDPRRQIAFYLRGGGDQRPAARKMGEPDPGGS